MFNKFELIGGGISIGLMALAVYLVQAQNIFVTGINNTAQSSQLIATQEPGIVVVDTTADTGEARAAAYLEAVDTNGNFQRMVIDDIKIGTGKLVEKGDIVAVHYKGELQGGGEFDNSRKRGQTFEFKVGGGQVIKGWDEGLIGMQVGGERVLVIPPEMAYGDQGIGPIPGGATLVFNIELVEIK